MRHLSILLIVISILNYQCLLFGEEKKPKPANIIYPGDNEYYCFLAEGQKYEDQVKLQKALDYYNKALNIKRYEIPSYYVLLDIGRVYYKLGNYKIAIVTLEKYLNYIIIELKIQNGDILPPDGLIIPAYTKDGLSEVLSDKSEAEAIIRISNLRIEKEQKRKNGFSPNCAR